MSIYIFQEKTLFVHVCGPSFSGDALPESFSIFYFSLICNFIFSTGKEEAVEDVNGRMLLEDGDVPNMWADFLRSC